MRHAALIFLTAIALAPVGLAGMAGAAPAPDAADTAPAPDALKRLKNQNPAVRFQAAMELGRAGKMEHTSRLASLLADENAAVRDPAVSCDEVAEAAMWHARLIVLLKAMQDRVPTLVGGRGYA